MHDFIHKLEKDFGIKLIKSPKYTLGVNSFDLDKDGNVKILCLDGLNLRSLDTLLPISERLNELWLDGCAIEKLDSLKHFPNLTKLGLYGNPIFTSTLESLSFSPKLKELDLGGTNINDTSSLSSLNSLEKLSLNGSDVLVEVKGLKDLHCLKCLNLEFTQVDNVKNVHANENIRFMNLRNSKIKSISGLDRFPNLEELELSSNPISKINGLNEAKSLKRLTLSSTSIDLIEGLQHLTNLEILDLGNNKIEKIQGLETLTELRKLSLNQNKITKVENLENLHNLEYVLLEVNKIVEFDPHFLYNLHSPCFISLVGNPIETLNFPIPDHIEIQFETDYWMPKGL